jgi:hypothetical protein
VVDQEQSTAFSIPWRIGVGLAHRAYLDL